ncbi:MAG: hypothetical protein EF811_06650 [Methanonatronarchaeia archaeon]|nr:MAG: hypothetical protein EF811_06650 [Methanonatronarchaeia archaeon]
MGEKSPSSRSGRGVRLGMNHHNLLGKGLAEVTPAETVTSTEHRDQNNSVFCDVSASCVIETGSPFHNQAPQGA